MAGWSTDISSMNIDSDTGMINNNGCSTTDEGIVTLTDNNGNNYDYFYNLESCACGDDTLVIYLDDWGTGATDIAYQTRNLRLKSVDDCAVVAMRGSTAATEFESSFNFKTSGGHKVYYKMFDSSKVETSGFTGCGQITRVYLGEKINTIENFAFTNNSKLESVCAPGISKIGNLAFSNCQSLFSFTFNNRLQVGPAAFANCYKLTNFVYDDGCDCTNTTSSTGISFGYISSAANNAFANCSGLTGAVTIYFNMMQGTIHNTGFSALTINSTTIDVKSFNDCLNLKSVTFGLGGSNTTAITNIDGNNAVLFSGCTGITDVYIANSNTKLEIPNNCTAFNHGGNVNVYVKSSMLSQYQNDTKWTSGANVTFYTY
jgi:hypothetical protein